MAGIAAKPEHNKRYALLNNLVVRDKVVRAAADRFGYEVEQVELRLYVGKFAGKLGTHDEQVKAWCSTQHVGAGPFQVISVNDVVAKVRHVAEAKQYRDNAALVALKVLEAAGALKAQGA